MFQTRSPLCPALLAGFLLLPGAASAITRTVGASGADFTSLKAAIAAANAGDVIDIRSTVTEAGIIVTKNLTIKSTLSTPQIVQAAATPNTATDRVIYIGPGAAVTLENLVIRHGVFSGGNGGGIGNFGTATLQRVRLEKNTAASGGAILSSGAVASLALLESTVESNFASVSGGGLLAENSTQVTIRRSTFDKNIAFEGGAIKCRTGSTLLLETCTVSMNRASNGGGGLFNEDGKSEVQSCTFALNTLRAVQNNNPAANSLVVANTILADSLTSSFLPGGEDCAVFLGATITDAGYNLVENRGSVSFAGAGTVTGVDPKLGALADYGGPTRTHVPLGGSPALETGNSIYTVDQRGIARPQGGAKEKGAFEYQAAGEATRPNSFAAPVFTSGEMHPAEFKSIQFRGPNFAVQVQNADGSFSSVTPNFYNHATYFGTVDDVRGALAGATYFPNAGSLYFHVIFDNGREWDNEGGTTRVRYLDPIATTTWPGMEPPAGGAGSTLYADEVAVDLPSDRFITKHGSDANDALAMIEHSIMATNLVYMRQVGIQHRLGRVILRGSVARDPYAGLATHDLALDKVTDVWKNVLYTPQAPGTYDMVVVVHSEDSGGLAPVGAVGSPQGYSSCACTARGDFSGVFRHEGGHNWSLGHFDGQAPEGQTINSGNQNGKFSGPEEALILDFRQQKLAYLDSLGAATVPMPPCAGTDRAFLPSTSAAMPINLLANDHDANGDAITLVSFASASELTLGGTLSSTSTPGVVQYNRPVSSTPTTAIDRFRYRIRDASGLEAEGYVFVRLNNIVPSGKYTQDFNAFADGTLSLGDGSYSGSRGIEGVVPVSTLFNALQLTPDIGGQYNTFTLPSPPSLASGFHFSFSFAFAATGTPADYLAVNFGRQVNNSRLFAGLTVEFNSYSPKGLSVKLNGTTVANGFLAKTGLVDNTYHAVEVLWLPAQGVTVKLDGATAFARLALPGFSPGADAVMGFSAFTGALSQRTIVDTLTLLGPTADEDGDGIPSVYELAYGLNRLSAADASTDADGDGFTALVESRFGTAANDRASKPVWEIVKLNATTARLNFGPVKAGHTYIVRSSTGGTFTPILTYTPNVDLAVGSFDAPIDASGKIFLLDLLTP